MKLELVWMMLPLTGVLSQIGGYCWKAARRYGIPVVALVFVGITLGVDFLCFIMAVHLWASYCLPVTLFGDSIPGDWRNWLWLPVWGVFMCSSVLWLNWLYWPVVLICGLLMALLVVLSNIKATAKWFQWKFCELGQGLFPLMPLCYLITQQ